MHFFTLQLFFFLAVVIRFARDLKISGPVLPVCALLTSSTVDIMRTIELEKLADSL